MLLLLLLWLLVLMLLLLLLWLCGMPELLFGIRAAAPARVFLRAALLQKRWLSRERLDDVFNGVLCSTTISATKMRLTCEAGLL